MTEVVAMTGSATLDLNMALTGILVSQGWATQGVTAVTSAYTTLPTDAVILADATSGAFTVTLADATQPGFVPGQRYTVIKTDSSGHNVTVAGSAGQDIGGASTQTLSTTNGFISVVFDGVNTDNWWIWAATATGSGSPSGPAGGDLSGTYPNPTVAKINGTAFTLPVALSHGGTGTSAGSAGAAFNALSPMTATGDMIAGGSSGAGQRLAGNTTTSTAVLTSTGSGSAATVPAWLIVAASASFHPSNPTATTSTSAVMMGFGVQGTPVLYTPAGSGKVMVNMAGLAYTATAAVQFTLSGRYGILAGPATTVASGSNGGEISQVASWSSPSAGVLDVASTSGYATSGTVWVAASGSTVAQVTYTGTAAGQLTGCGYVSGSATGTVATGGSVTGAPQNGTPVAGTRFGANTNQTLQAPAASPGTGFALTDVVSLTAGTTYWFDAALQTSAGADAATMQAVGVSLAEQTA